MWVGLGGGSGKRPSAVLFRRRTPHPPALCTGVTAAAAHPPGPWRRWAAARDLLPPPPL